MTDRSIPAWYRSFYRRLTAEECDSEVDPDLADTSAARFVAWLAERGWSPSAMADHVRQVRAAGQQWPDPSLEPTGLGPAQQSALLVEVLELLGNPQWHKEMPNPSALLTRDDERLLREVPPHHG